MPSNQQVGEAVLAALSEMDNDEFMRLYEQAESYAIDQPVVGDMIWDGKDE